MSRFETCAAKRWLGLLLQVAALLFAPTFLQAQPPPQQGDVADHSAPLDRIRAYIASGWQTLSRSMEDCKTFEDVKTTEEAVLYFPADFPVPPKLRDVQARCGIRLAHLPRKITA